MKAYQRREADHARLLQRQARSERRISNLRLLVFVLGIGAATLLYMLHHYPLGMAAILAFFVLLYIYLVKAHGRLQGERKITALLRDINSTAIKRVTGGWHTFPDHGGEFRDDRHSYTGDLDIFGENSLFQWTNTARTFMGRLELSRLLSGVSGNLDHIKARQEAVKELAPLLTWRQRFLAEGMMTTGRMHNQEDLIAWAGERHEFLEKAWTKALIRVCPLITVLLAAGGFVMDIIPPAFPSAALAAQFVFLAWKGKELGRTFSLAERYGEELRVYHKMLRAMEKQKFSSRLLMKIQKGLRGPRGTAAHQQIGRLSAIVDAIGNRRNMVYFFLNILTLWDFHHLIALEKWKRQSGALLSSWFAGLGEVEALASLAIIRFDNPPLVMPQLSGADEAFFESEDMGHPLLVGKRVHNDVALTGATRVLLITGSNMSGKSTLLRTAGINLVLAYAGAPVCAGSLRASVMEISSCMRVKDDLGENISSFYAELLRIKEIVHKAEANSRVFFLLDEVFKGTNSRDRHTGARVLINKLTATNSIGLVSTHDLELCDLEEENDKIANYHFQEYYEDNKIHFDYKLRPGPSTTRNALYLMRLAGIDAAAEGEN